MTQEEKAKAYDEAIERAKKELQACGSQDCDAYRQLTRLFPELKSEDEMIRNFLIKQANSVLDSITDDDEEVPAWKSALAWLEKQGEKKPDKVEPKFSEGEWITNGDYTWKIVEVKPLDYILQSQDGNIVDDTISHVDEQFHSFTIQDAKDGDVLYSPCLSLLWIFKSRDTVYCGCNLNYNDGAFCGEGYIEMPTDAIPATKEQRDLLFQKMKEAGYEWNAEKKELKLLITNGGDFESYGQRQECLDCQFNYAGECKGSCAMKRGEQKPANEEMIETIRTEYEKGRADAIAEMQKEWSEDDKLVVEDIEEAVINYWHGQSQEDLLDWLKSLKERYTWKPSDEQMITLRHVISGCSYDIEPLVELETKLKEL